jgi:uncharacterized protein YjbI with pentapeptide repeats
MGNFSSHWPAPLDGGVFDVLPEGILGRGYIQGRRTAFLAMLQLPSDGSSSDFRNCLFDSGVYLDSEGGDAGDLRLSGSTILSDSSFEGAAMRNLQCLRAIFCESLDFDDANVRERADFGRAKFHGGATFQRFKARSFLFLECAFADLADFEGAVAKTADFSEACFSGEAILADADLKKATFSRASFAADANFAGFNSSDADFQRCSWALNVDFTSADFGVVDFTSAKFAAAARFTEATFRGEMIFTDACFSGATAFDQVGWPAKLDDFQGAFRDARFERSADFRNKSFKAFAAFDGVLFKGKARFEPAAFKHDAGFKAALALARTRGEELALGHGLRTLRHAAENVRDRVSEQRFHRYELLTRRTQREVSRGEKLMSMLYGGSSRYGYSLGTPLGWVAALWGIGALFYLIIGAQLGLSSTQGLTVIWGASVHPAAYDAAQFSARSIFSLFGVWSLRPPDPKVGIKTFEDGLLWTSASWGLWVRLLSSFQSVLAGVLLFLVGLAVRRRFQIA